MIDVTKVLEAVPGEKPCGPNLEYDPAFTELERLAQGRPEQQIGDSVTAAEEPNWRDIENRAAELLVTTKDLRIAVHLTGALVETGGFPGLADGLAVIRGMLEQYWDSVHPELDPDDDNDPTMRINTLAALCESDGMLNSVRMAPLVDTRGLGRFSLRDLAIASGELEVEESDKPQSATIEAAFMGSDIEALQATAQAVATASDHAVAIQGVFSEHLGAGFGPDLSNLSGMLAQAKRAIDERLAQRGVGGVEAPVEAAADGGDGEVAAAAPAPLRGQVSSREQVVEALDKICDYFERHEPSSPIPLLLNRAKRLVHKSFIEIIRDIAPDGVTQVETLRGPENEQSG